MRQTFNAPWTGSYDQLEQKLLKERVEASYHYIAPGKKNLAFHLASQHPHLLHTEKELLKWSIEELEKTHKEMHG